MHLPGGRYRRIRRVRYISGIRSGRAPIQSGYSPSFAPGGISGGPAAEVAGYDLSAGCLVTNNIALDAPPVFVSTSLESPHFCRPAMRNGAWTGTGKGYAWTDDGEYPDWIGARPAWVPELYRTLLILR